MILSSKRVENILRDRLYNKIWIKVGVRLREQIWDCTSELLFFDEISLQFRNRILFSLGGQTHEQLYNQTKYQVNNNNMSTKEAQPQQPTVTEKKKKELEFIEHYFGLGHETWISFYDYFRKIGILKNDDYNRYSDFLQKGIWSMQLFKDWCIVTRMPKKIHRDRENRLHSLDGTAIEWWDSTTGGVSSDKNYFIHGVPFNDESLWEKVVTQKITMKEVMRVSNMEQRNAILAVISPEKFIKELDAKLISTHIQKKKGREYMDEESYNKLNHKEIKLYEVKNNEISPGMNENIYILLYTDPSTNREYFSFIEPKHATSALDAMASKFGLTAKEYTNNIIAES